MMKKTILAASAAILAIGGAAYAAQPADRNADMTMAEAKAKSDEMFTRMDVNGDGKIDKADREAKQAERFAAKDTNGDGVLSEEEFAARGERGDGERSGHKGHRGGKRGGGMAMMKMAPRSSMMARAVKNTFREGGTRLPSKLIKAMAKAISVAVGIPMPRKVSGEPMLLKK